MSLIVNEPNSQQDANNIRRAFKIAQNAHHKLKQSSGSPDLWSVQAKRARQNLRDNVRRVLLGAPAEYGEMKLEITAWQYSVHNVISKLKKEHRGSKSNQTNYHIKTFLESTHGWYSSFMFQLLDKLSEYGGAENLNFDWWSPKEMTHAADKTEDTDNANKANIQQILLSICYKTLLCLGDICRYQNDFFPESYSISMSYRYYMQAWHMDWSSGMPWNNIGTLTAQNYHGVLSLFFYRRCLQSENPYVDCYKNLKCLFDKSKRCYISYPRNQMDNIPISASIPERKQSIYWFCVVFVHLNGLLRPATYCTERELNTCCRRMLDLLDLCLYFTDDTKEEETIVEDEPEKGFIKRSGPRIEGPYTFTNSFLVVIFAVLIQTFDDLRKQSSNRLNAANTLFVSTADFIVNHALAKIKDFEIVVDEDEEAEKASIVEDEIEDDDEEESDEIKRKERFRRRRQEEDLSEGDEDISASSEEEIFYETEEDDSVYSQEMDSDEERPISVSKNINNNTNHPILEEEDSGEDETESIEPVQKPANRNTRLACSFVTKHEDINEESEDSDDAEDINEDEEDEEEANEDEMVFEFETPTNQEDPEENDEEPEAEEEIKLSLEDIVKNLDSFVFLEAIKLLCDWLSVNDEIIRSNAKSPLWIRLAQMCNFLPISELIQIRGTDNLSPDLSKVLEQDSWMQTFSLWEDRFLYGIPIMSDVHDHIDFKASTKMTRWDECLFRIIAVRKFMRHLAEKFPETEIKLVDDKFIYPALGDAHEGEFNIRGTFNAEAKDNKTNEQYVLVPTPEAMAFNLHHFKSLVDNPKFSTIVTNITVDGLDEMKKTSKEARDTTRWLDISFSRCIGNVQSMQQPEQKSLQRLRRSDMQAWILQHLINIGSKLQRQRKTVVLLVNAVDGQMSPSVRKALSSASANNLSIQTVEDFVRQIIATD